MLDDRGFTLIEVLTAVTVMSIVLGLFISLFGGGLRSVKTTQGYSRALLLAGEKLDEGFSAEDSVLYEAEEGGTVNGYGWSRSASPFSSDADSETREDGGLYRVEVRVEWKDGLKSKEITLYGLQAPRDQGYTGGAGNDG